MSYEERLSGDRQVIGSALQSRGAPWEKPDSVLTGWVVIAEFMDPEGGKWLTKLGSEGLTDWGRNGLLHEALFGNWHADDDA